MIFEILLKTTLSSVVVAIILFIYVVFRVFFTNNKNQDNTEFVNSHTSVLVSSAVWYILVILSLMLVALTGITWIWNI